MKGLGRAWSTVPGEFASAVPKMSFANLEGHKKISQPINHVASPRQSAKVQDRSASSASRNNGLGNSGLETRKASRINEHPADAPSPPTGVYAKSSDHAVQKQRVRSKETVVVTGDT